MHDLGDPEPGDQVVPAMGVGQVLPHGREGKAGRDLAVGSDHGPASRDEAPDHCAADQPAEAGDENRCRLSFRRVR